MKLPGAVSVQAISSVTILLLLSGTGCYETTPHRVEVAARVASPACAATVRGVFAGAGFVQLPSAPRQWMLFAPSGTSGSTALHKSGAAVGVTFAGVESQPDDCHVTLEALSQDATCPGAQTVGSGPLGCSGLVDRRSPMECLVGPQPMCQLTSSPSRDNDAAVDELARQLRAALGPKSRVD